MKKFLLLCLYLIASQTYAGTVDANVTGNVTAPVVSTPSSKFNGVTEDTTDTQSETVVKKTPGSVSTTTSNPGLNTGTKTTVTTPTPNPNQ